MYKQNSISISNSSGIEAREDPRAGHVGQSAVDHPLDRPQRAPRLDQVLDVKRVVDRRLTLGCALHPQLFAPPFTLVASWRQFFNSLLGQPNDDIATYRHLQN